MFLEWVLEMEPSFVRQISGYSMMRAKQLILGPLVYCLKRLITDRIFMNAVVDVQGKLELYGKNIGRLLWNNSSWSALQRQKAGMLIRRRLSGKQAVKLKAVPYFLWNNRGKER